MSQWPTRTWQDVRDPSRHFVKAAMKHLRDLAGGPLRVLEIGVWQGGSAEWLLEEVLTHADSRYLGIDVDVKPQAAAVAERFKGKAELVKGKSFDVLKSGYVTPSFDLIHIDGCHATAAAFADGVLCWPLLAPGGLMAWDDLHHNDKHPGSGEHHPVVEAAFDAFCALHRGEIEILERERQGWIRRLR